MKFELASVIIPVFNQWKLTRRCLQSLDSCLEKGKKVFPIEVIVVDNGSFDDTRRELALLSSQLPHVGGLIRPLLLEKNGGFASGCNQGASIAQGKVLIFLNNDTEVFPGCLEVLSETLGAQAQIGVVGGRLLYPDGTIQHAGMALDEQGLWHHVFRGFPGEHPFVLERRSFQAVTGALLAIRKEDFEAVGKFEEGYRNSHEDVDLCLKVQSQLQKQVIYEPRATLIHFESQSESPAKERRESAIEFSKRWGSKLNSDWALKTMIFAEKFLFQKKVELEEALKAKDPYRHLSGTDWESHPEGLYFRNEMLQVALMEAEIKRLQGQNLRVRLQNWILEPFRILWMLWKKFQHVRQNTHLRK